LFVVGSGAPVSRGVVGASVPLGRLGGFALLLSELELAALGLVLGLGSIGVVVIVPPGVVVADVLGVVLVEPPGVVGVVVSAAPTVVACGVLVEPLDEAAVDVSAALGALVLLGMADVVVSAAPVVVPGDGLVTAPL